MNAAKLMGAGLILAAIVTALFLWRGKGNEARDPSGSAVLEPERQLEAERPNETTSAADEQASLEGVMQIPVPNRYRFGKTDSVGVAENTDELLGRYTGEELTYLIEFYHGFTPEGSGFDVLDFRSREELAWLVNKGYPMPSEVLEARRLSNDELLELGREGNIKAQMFYIDRTAASIGSPPSSGQMTPEQILAGGEWNTTMDSVVASGSPFAGYVVAKARLQSGRNGGAVAAYQLAQALGDSRAQAAVVTLSESGADASTELAVFYGLLQTLSRRSDVNQIFRSGEQGFPGSL